MPTHADPQVLTPCMFAQRHTRHDLRVRLPNCVFVNCASAGVIGCTAAPHVPHQNSGCVGVRPTGPSGLSSKRTEDSRLPGLVGGVLHRTQIRLIRMAPFRWRQMAGVADCHLPPPLPLSSRGAQSLKGSAINFHKDALVNTSGITQLFMSRGGDHLPKWWRETESFFPCSNVESSNRRLAHNRHQSANNRPSSSRTEQWHSRMPVHRPLSEEEQLSPGQGHSEQRRCSMAAVGLQFPELLLDDGDCERVPYFGQSEFWRTLGWGERRWAIVIGLVSVQAVDGCLWGLIVVTEGCKVALIPSAGFGMGDLCHCGVVWSSRPSGWHPQRGPERQRWRDPALGSPSLVTLCTCTGWGSPTDCADYWTCDHPFGSL